jgi:hypothetical protein
MMMRARAAAQAAAIGLARFQIPPSELERLRPAARAERISKARVQALADELGIHPGIVVGRLQHEGWLPHTHLNGLRTRLTWQA